MKKLLASFLFLLSLARADAQQINGGQFSYPIGQSTLPLIFPSSGTMGNNGALTMTTALPNTYSNAYVYMPAGAIAASGAGSAAGWYYATCSSTTACTLFNNVYTNGTPTIPASPTAFSTTGPGAYTQVTNTEIAAYQCAIPANVLGSNGGVEAEGTLSLPTNVNNKQIKIRFGASGTGGTAYLDVGVTAVMSMVADAGFRNRSNTGSQISTKVRSGTNGYGSSGSVLSISTFDTTQQQWSVTSLQLAVATDFVVLEASSVKVVVGVP